MDDREFAVMAVRRGRHGLGEDVLPIFVIGAESLEEAQTDARHIVGGNADITVIEVCPTIEVAVAVLSS